MINRHAEVRSIEEASTIQCNNLALEGIPQSGTVHGGCEKFEGVPYVINTEYKRSFIKLWRTTPDSIDSFYPFRGIFTLLVINLQSSHHRSQMVFNWLM